MVMVVWLMVVVLAFGLAMALVDLSSSNATTHDVRLSRAQQAADAGVQAALYEQSENTPGNAGSAFDLNGGLLGATLRDCLAATFDASLQITGLAAASVTGNYPCPGGGSAPGGNVEPEPVGNHAYYESEYFPSPSAVLGGASPVELAPRIVSLGIDEQNASHVYSREEAILDPITPLPVIGGNDNITVYGLSGLSGLLAGTVDSALTSLGATIGLQAGAFLGDSNLATVIDGDVEAANNVTLPGVDASLNLTLNNGLSANSQDNGLSGLLEYGGTLSPPNAITTAEVRHQAPPAEQPITVAATTPSCPTSAPNCGLGSYGSGTPFYSASTDSVTVPAGQTMTIPGGMYVLCNFNAAGSVIASPTSTQPVEIFIDNPNSSRCAGNPPLTASDNPNFGGHAEDSYGDFVAQQGISCTSCLATPSQLQVYVVGDDPQAPSPDDGNTFVQIGGYEANLGLGGQTNPTNTPAAQAMVLYAPTSEVSLSTVECVAGLICVPGVFEGNIIGTDVYATAAAFQQDLDLGGYALYSGLDLYHVRRYVECSAVSSLTGNESTDTGGC
jgi:hypothetical protein